MTASASRKEAAYVHFEESFSPQSVRPSPRGGGEKGPNFRHSPPPPLLLSRRVCAWHKFRFNDFKDLDAGTGGESLDRSGNPLEKAAERSFFNLESSLNFSHYISPLSFYEEMREKSAHKISGACDMSARRRQRLKRGKEERSKEGQKRKLRRILSIADLENRFPILSPHYACKSYHFHDKSFISW